MGLGDTGKDWWLNGYLYGIFEKKYTQCPWDGYGTQMPCDSKADGLGTPGGTLPPRYLFIKPVSGSGGSGCMHDAHQSAFDDAGFRPSGAGKRPTNVKFKTNIEDQISLTSS